jgi:hypothetical protein
MNHNGPRYMCRVVRVILGRIVQVNRAIRGQKNQDDVDLHNWVVVVFQLAQKMPCLILVLAQPKTMYFSLICCERYAPITRRAMDFLHMVKFIWLGISQKMHVCLSACLSVCLSANRSVRFLACTIVRIKNAQTSLHRKSFNKRRKCGKKENYTEASEKFSA